MTTLQEKFVVTKKEHQCLFCTRTFPPKTRMHYWCGIYDGDFSSNYTCETCEALTPYIDDHHDGYVFGCVVEICLDCNVDTPEDLLRYFSAE